MLPHILAQRGASTTDPTTPCPSSVGQAGQSRAYPCGYEIASKSLSCASKDSQRQPGRFSCFL